MLEQAHQLLTQKKYMLQGLLFLGFFLVIYTVIDGFNISYAQMITTYGLYLVLINIVLNLLMATSSAYLMNLSTIMAVLKGKEGNGSTLGFGAVLFGILTYGCTPCVIAFFANIGIAFSVIVLPLAGLPYKLVSLGLIWMGIWWTRREIENGQCKVDFTPKV